MDHLLKQIITAFAAVIIPGAGLYICRREILEGINNLRGGGPRPPSHPLPAGDGALIRIWKRKSAPDPRHYLTPPR